MNLEILTFVFVWFFFCRLESPQKTDSLLIYVLASLRVDSCEAPPASSRAWSGSAQLCPPVRHNKAIYLHKVAAQQLLLCGATVALRWLSRYHGHPALPARSGTLQPFVNQPAAAKVCEVVERVSIARPLSAFAFANAFQFL